MAKKNVYLTINATLERNNLVKKSTFRGMEVMNYSAELAVAKGSDSDLELLQAYESMLGHDDINKSNSKYRDGDSKEDFTSKKTGIFFEAYRGYRLLSVNTSGLPANHVVDTMLEEFAIEGLEEGMEINASIALTKSPIDNNRIVCYINAIQVVKRGNKIAGGGAMSKFAKLSNIPTPKLNDDVKEGIETESQRKLREAEEKVKSLEEKLAKLLEALENNNGKPKKDKKKKGKKNKKDKKKKGKKNKKDKNVETNSDKTDDESIKF